MLHYAVNRPVGALRGESDLAPILPWLKRYSRWLEDRVRLNAGVRAFLWVVKAPARLRTELAERYRQPPEPGSVIIADEQEIVDGRHPQPQRQRRRQRRPRHPLDDRRRRPRHLPPRPRRRRRLQPRHRPGDDRDAPALPAPAAGVHGLAADRPGAGGLAPVCSWATGGCAHNVTAADITAVLPDISVDDNQKLAQAAMQLASGLSTVAQLVGSGPAYRKMALRLVREVCRRADHEQDRADAAQMIHEGQVTSARSTNRRNNEGHAAIGDAAGQ